MVKGLLILLQQRLNFIPITIKPQLRFGGPQLSFPNEVDFLEGGLPREEPLVVERGNQGYGTLGGTVEMKSTIAMVDFIFIVHALLI